MRGQKGMGGTHAKTMPRRGTKRHLLSRYERDETGHILIDVSATRVEELYNNFDKRAPYIRRDLDQDLVDYLIECAEEIGKEPFLIRIRLDQAADEDQLSRVRRSIAGYFAYLAEIERHKVQRMMRTSLLLMITGLALFAVVIWTGGFFGEDRTVAENVIAEGMTVAAWVALWEALAKFVIEWPSYRNYLRLYRRLSESSVVIEGKG